MHINAIKLRIVTPQGDFGFFVPFGKGLTIIRGNNSSGKSTLFLSLLYGLGMEEIAGGRNESVLPYAVKEHFAYGEQRVPVLASEVYVEIQSKSGEIVTLRRAIRDTEKSPKLIEILDGAHLTGKPEAFSIRPTYLHDAGAAQKAEGFHVFLERFLGFRLPSVPATSGSETKLYLQAIFAALAVEQKRGWTDYIANIPFFGIRDARTRVVEYLLALDVFETNSARSQLNADSVAIASAWESKYQSLQRALNDVGAVAQGVPTKVTALFSPEQVVLHKRVANDLVTIPQYVGALRKEHENLSKKVNLTREDAGAEAQEALDGATRELYRLANIFETASGQLALQTASAREYEQLRADAQEDLSRNRTALKLRNLGALVHGLELASDRCPTCHQPVENSLLVEMAPGPQMDLETNIAYLEKQVRMLERQINGNRMAVDETKALMTELSRRMEQERTKLSALRDDLATGATESRAVVRQQVQIEIEVVQL